MSDLCEREVDENGDENDDDGVANGFEDSDAARANGCVGREVREERCKCVSVRVFMRVEIERKSKRYNDDYHYYHDNSYRVNKLR